MANVISSLLVGLGLELDEKSFNNAERSLDKVAVKARVLSTLAATAFTVKVVLKTADAIVGINNLKTRLGEISDVNSIKALENAVGIIGGGSKGMVDSRLQSFADMANRTELEKAQQESEFNQKAADAGPEALNAYRRVLASQDPTENYKAYIQELSSAAPKIKKLLFEAFGGDDSDYTLAKNKEAFDKELSKQNEQVSGLYEDDTASRELMTQWGEFKSEMESLGIVVGKIGIEPLTVMLTGFNETLDSLLPTIKKLGEAAGNIAGEHPYISSAAAVGAAAGTGLVSWKALKAMLNFAGIGGGAAAAAEGAAATGAAGAATLGAAEGALIFNPLAAGLTGSYYLSDKMRSAVGDKLDDVLPDFMTTPFSAYFDDSRDEKTKDQGSITDVMSKKTYKKTKLVSNPDVISKDTDKKTKLDGTAADPNIRPRWLDILGVEDGPTAANTLPIQQKTSITVNVDGRKVHEDVYTTEQDSNRNSLTEFTAEASIVG